LVKELYLFFMDEKNKKIENFDLKIVEKAPPGSPSPEQRENISAPEKEPVLDLKEANEEKKEITSEKEGKESEGVSIGGATPQYKEREKKIEKILEEDIGDLYLKMPPEKQQEFKIEGENASRAINVILSSAKVKANKIIQIIKKWLSLIPGVNKFFLEQEVKIKTDKILNLNRE